MNNSIPQGSINDIDNNNYNNIDNDSAALINNRDDLNTTETDLEDERRELERQQEELNKTNLFKTRVIDSEINSSLVFQVSLYYNFYYTFLCFILQLSSCAYKAYIFKQNSFTVVSLVLVVIWFIASLIRLNIGYSANIQESVSISAYTYLTFHSFIIFYFLY